MKWNQGFPVGTCSIPPVYLSLFRQYIRVQARIMGLGLQVRLSIPVYFSVEGKEKYFHPWVVQNPIRLSDMRRTCTPAGPVSLWFHISGSFCIKTTTKSSLISRGWEFVFAAQDSEAEGSLGNLAVVGQQGSKSVYHIAKTFRKWLVCYDLKCFFTWF